LIKKLLKLGRKSVVDRAEVKPFLLDDLRFRTFPLGLGIFGKDNGKSSNQVPICRYGECTLSEEVLKNTPM